MTYLVNALYTWLVAAAVLGLAVGFFTCKAGRPASWKGWPVVALFLYVIGLVAAVLHVLPGRQGFWLETALLLAGVYFVACGLGCLFRSVFGGSRAARPAPELSGLPEAPRVSGDPVLQAAAAAARSSAAPAVLTDEAATAGTAPAAPAPDLADSIKTLAGAAAELAAAAPAALAASSAAQALLTGDAPAVAPAPVAPAPEMADSVRTLAGHAAELAAAAPSALAASSAAQALLTGQGPAVAPAPVAPAPDLADSVKTLAGHAAELAAAAPAALAASSAAQAFLAGDAPAVAPASVAPAPEMADSVKALAGHAAELAAAAPLALAASSAAQALLTGGAPVAETASVAPAPEMADSVKTLAGHAEDLAAAAPAPAAALAASPPPAAERPENATDEDKLWWIEGVGKKMTRKLHEVGVWRFSQVAAWTPEQARWIGEHFGEPGRVEGENWIAQAALLANHGDAEFSRAAREGKIARDEDGATPAESTQAAPAAAIEAEADAKSQPPSEPRPERAEDESNLRQIFGIGDKISHELRQLGIWRFSQIAAWTPEQQAWISSKLAHCGPVARSSWVAQAQLLAAGIETEHARAVRLGEADVLAPDTEAFHATLPELIAPHANDELYAGKRPVSLLHPPLGEKSDLTQIEGVDAETAGRLNALGVWTYAQIAHWSDMNARWIGSYLAFPGRVERENWIEQARVLRKNSAM